MKIDKTDPFNLKKILESKNFYVVCAGCELIFDDNKFSEVVSLAMRARSRPDKKQIEGLLGKVIIDICPNCKKNLKNLFQKCFEETILYYHCCYCHKIFEDPERRRLIVDMLEYFHKEFVPTILGAIGDFKITSSFCDYCLPIYKRELGLPVSS